MNFSIEGSNPSEEKNFNQISKQTNTGEGAKFTKSPRVLKQSDIFRTESGQNTGQKMEIEEKVPYTEIRMRLPTVWDQYRFLVDNQKLYLPKWEKVSKKPKWATEKYLVDVMLGKNFSLKIEQIKKAPPVTRQMTKGELLELLERLANKPLGFEFDRGPPKKWVKKMIYSLNPDHEIFKPTIEEVIKTIPIGLK